MTRQWKAGDVGLVVCSDGQERQATCEPDPNRRASLAWRFPDRVYRHVENSEARPLLVLDPENRDQVEHLVCLLADNGWTPSRRDGARAALRTMLEPSAPPRPVEPTDIGSWVTDGEGYRWVLMPPAYGARRWCRWYMSRPGTDSSNRAWTDLVLPVTVGEPDEPEAEAALPPDLVDSLDRTWRWGTPRAEDGYAVWAKTVQCWMHSVGREDVERIAGPLREVPHGSAVTR